MSKRVFVAVYHSFLGCSFLAAAFTATPSTIDVNNKNPRLEFPGLDESMFRHPLDRDLTWLIQGLPGGSLAERGLRQAFPMLEQGVRLDLLSTSVKVSERQLPHLQQLLQEACDILDLSSSKNESNNSNKREQKKKSQRIPELYVQSSPQANAYTLAIRGKDEAPVLVVTSALLDQCSDVEIQAVLGHELGHLKCEHSLYLTLGGLAFTPLRNLPFVGNTVVDRTLQRWRLAAEYTCDRASLLVAQDTSVVAGALLKLFAGTGRYNLSTDAFVAQCLEYDALLKDANPLVRATIRREQSQRTHPLPVRRVAELQSWAESNDYKTLLQHGSTKSKSSDTKVG